MASGIATATAEPETVRTPAAQPAEAPAAARRRRRRRLSPLTRRILAVNVLAIALLGLGLLYLGEYQQSLVSAELESLKTQGQIFAAALGEGAVIDVAGEGEALVPELGRDMMRRLVEPTHTRARLFDNQGALVGDTRVMRGPGGAVQVQELPAPGSVGLLDRIDAAASRFLSSTLPWHSSYRPYRERPEESAGDYPEVGRALAGDIVTAVREDRQSGGLLLTVAVPVQRYKQVLGTVLLSKGSGEIEQAVRAVRFEILKVFVIALGVTVLLSIYLAGTIVQPVRRLAAAAERVRRLPGRHVAIPDLTKRRDEIGDLSAALSAT